MEFDGLTGPYPHSRHAQFDAMAALDFVSLLLSGVRPTHAEASMSRHLKDTIASGTLGSDSIRKKDSTQSEKADNETISKGWRSESLMQSASSLLNAASRLAQESEREQMYWEDVLDVKREGWAICRVPREPQSLGVRFGFSEGIVPFAFTVRQSNRKPGTILTVHSWCG